MALNKILLLTYLLKISSYKILQFLTEGVS